VPQCSRVELMETNNQGFNVATFPCEFGVCDATSMTQTSAADVDAMAFGPGADYTIDSTQSYAVKTAFVAKHFLADDSWDLDRIETTLS